MTFSRPKTLVTDTRPKLRSLGPDAYPLTLDHGRASRVSVQVAKPAWTDLLSVPGEPVGASSLVLSPLRDQNAHRPIYLLSFGGIEDPL